MKQTFIISIFLLVLCIIISQWVGYVVVVEGYRNTRTTTKPKTTTKPATTTKPTTTPTPTTTPPEPVPQFIMNYKSSTSTYLSPTQIQDSIHVPAAYASKVPTINSAANLQDYLKFLKKHFDTNNNLLSMIYFCVSLPSAFAKFYTPTSSIPYNQLQVNMPDIFRKSEPYTQIQTMCILWKQSMNLFAPSGPIIDPTSTLFTVISTDYINQIKECISSLMS